MLRRRRRQAGSTQPEGVPVGNQFGWRAHEAIQGWTASVDIKASIVLVVETAVAGAATRALIARDGELHSAVGLHLAVSVAAVALLALSVGCALWVVFPRLARRRNSTSTPNGLLYFGHLRAHSSEQIAAALDALTIDEERRQLAEQLHVTGKVAWRKHVWLQRSLVLLAIGAVAFVLSFVAFGDASDQQEHNKTASEIATLKSHHGLPLRR